jgi:hypothetical protein
METLQNEKLWVEKGIRSPYWPLGSSRIVQYRVDLTKETCVTKEPDAQGARRLDAHEAANPSPDSSSNSDSVDSPATADESLNCHQKFGDDKVGLLACLQNIFSPECNTVFIKDINELGIPREEGTSIWVPADPSKCAIENCLEFKWDKKLDTNGFIG